MRSFPRGRLGLTAAIQNPPDLILLDINMPEMNGYEMCEKLKSDKKLSQIPVIFLSALDATADKVKAFQSGGVDYVSKPFQFEEVQARVETHLQLRMLQQALELQNNRLEETVRIRTRELSEAHERLKILDRAKSDFLSLHEEKSRICLQPIAPVVVERRTVHFEAEAGSWAKKMNALSIELIGCVRVKVGMKTPSADRLAQKHAAAEFTVAATLIQSIIMAAPKGKVPSQVQRKLARLAVRVILRLLFRLGRPIRSGKWRLLSPKPLQPSTSDTR